MLVLENNLQFQRDKRAYRLRESLGKRSSDVSVLFVRCLRDLIIAYELTVNAFDTTQKITHMVINNFLNYNILLIWILFELRFYISGNNLTIANVYLRNNIATLFLVPPILQLIIGFYHFNCKIR